MTHQLEAYDMFINMHTCQWCSDAYLVPENNQNGPKNTNISKKL